LDKKISKSILHYYSDLFKKYGDNPKSLGWGNGRQSMRFQILNQIGNFQNCSILDVGCGFGDFFGFLKHKNIDFNYLGVDINEDFLSMAEKKYPSANFELRDIQKNKFHKKFDWVVGTGLTNKASTYPHLKNLLKEMFLISKKGVSIDFISNYVDFKDKSIFYTSPEIMFKFAKTLTRRITSRHDYFPFEFCLYLYKQDKKNSKNVFTDYFNQQPNFIKNDSWMMKVNK
jgi:ubiquinone/menaquinone biosynthesis C-methylase UbiE